MREMGEETQNHQENSRVYPNDPIPYLLTGKEGKGTKSLRAEKGPAGPSFFQHCREMEKRSLVESGRKTWTTTEKKLRIFQIRQPSYRAKLERGKKSPFELQKLTSETPT